MQHCKGVLCVKHVHDEQCIERLSKQSLFSARRDDSSGCLRYDVNVEDVEGSGFGFDALVTNDDVTFINVVFVDDGC